MKREFAGEGVHDLLAEVTDRGTAGDALATGLQEDGIRCVERGKLIDLLGLQRFGPLRGYLADIGSRSSGWFGYGFGLTVSNKRRRDAQRHSRQHQESCWNATRSARIQGHLRG